MVALTIRTMRPDEISIAVDWAAAEGWNPGLAHAGTRVIGLDGVTAQQENYRKSGFALAYANVRYGGTVAAPAAPRADVIALSDVPMAAVEADEATVFPAPRSAFLRAWIGSPGHVGY